MLLLCNIHIQNKLKPSQCLLIKWDKYFNDEILMQKRKYSIITSLFEGLH